MTALHIPTTTSHHLIQVLPQDVPNKVGRQLQEIFLSQSAQLLAIHLEPGVVEVGQAELPRGPLQPLSDVAPRPPPRV